MKKIKWINGEELVECTHCRSKKSYQVKYHIEEGVKITKKGEKQPYKRKVYEIAPPSNCARCKKYKKCESCEIIMCDLKQHINHQSSDPKLCNSCIGWEDKIKDICGGCESQMDLGGRKERYLSQGNFCDACMVEVNKNIQFKKEPAIKKEEVDLPDDEEPTDGWTDRPEYDKDGMPSE